jgi:hypothetical protein
MPPTGTIYSDSTEDIVRDIEHQFYLDAEKLVGLTKAYLEELAEGLRRYGCALAMMSVFYFLGGLLDFMLLTLRFKTNLRHWCARRYGDRVSSLNRDFPS